MKKSLFFGLNRGYRLKTRSLLSTIIAIVFLASYTHSKSPGKLTSDPSTTGEQHNYLFSYFINNGEDGFHLAYSHDGYKWTALKNNKSFLNPEAGTDRLMRDPCIVPCPDGLFRMVWTTSWKEKGIGYAYSKDLINWSEQKYIHVMGHESKTKNTWAPEIFYDETKDEYLIFWSSMIKGKYIDPNRREENRVYYTTTKDFETFSETKMFFNPGFNVIDSVIMKDEEKNRYVMFVKDETNDSLVYSKTIFLAYAKKPEGPYKKISQPITGKYAAEGPTVARINGKWFVYFDKFQLGRMGLVISDDLKNWKDVSDEVSFPEGTRHGTIFEVSREILDKLLELK